LPQSKPMLPGNVFWRTGLSASSQSTRQPDAGRG
jgi:hypothetical protein